MKQSMRGPSRVDTTPPSERTFSWWIWNILSRFADYFKWILLIGIFAFKFFEWWYASEDQIRRREKLPVPTPPEPIKVIHHVILMFDLVVSHLMMVFACQLTRSCAQCARRSERILHVFHLDSHSAIPVFSTTFQRTRSALFLKYHTTLSKSEPFMTIKYLLSFTAFVGVHLLHFLNEIFHNT
jgi:hypothetical protein